MKGFTDAGQPVRDSIGRGSVDTKRAVLQDRILKEQMLQKQLQLLESNSSNHVHKIEREEGEIVTERVEDSFSPKLSPKRSSSRSSSLQPAQRSRSNSDPQASMQVSAMPQQQDEHEASLAARSGARAPSPSPPTNSARGLSGSPVRDLPRPSPDSSNPARAGLSLSPRHGSPGDDDSGALQSSLRRDSFSDKRKKRAGRNGPRNERHSDDDDFDAYKFLEGSEDEEEPVVKAREATPPPLDEPEREPDHISALMGCRSVFEHYSFNNKIDAGVYGDVSRATEKRTGKKVALKRIKELAEKDKYKEFPQTAVREINLLLSIKHTNVVALHEVVVGVSRRNDKEVYMVMEYLENDMKMLLSTMNLKRNFSQAEVKCLLRQLLEGVAALHRHWIMHRDLKPSNLLLSSKGVLKICDLGLARRFQIPVRQYTRNVVTLYYRAPELLLVAPSYSCAIDMWSVGCIFAEFLTGHILLDFKPNKGEANEVALIRAMTEVLGTPTEDIWPGLNEWLTFKFGKIYQSKLREAIPLHPGVTGSTAYLSETGFDLLSRLLCYDPSKRITAAEALAHPYFNEAPLPLQPHEMESFRSMNENHKERELVKKKARERENQRANLVRQLSQEKASKRR